MTSELLENSWKNHKTLERLMELFISDYLNRDFSEHLPELKEVTEELPYISLLFYLVNGGGYFKDYVLTTEELTKFTNNLKTFKEYPKAYNMRLFLFRLNNGIKRIFYNIGEENHQELLEIFKKFNRLELLVAVILLGQKNSVNGKENISEVSHVEEYLNKVYSLNKHILSGIEKVASNEHSSNFMKNPSNIFNGLSFIDAYKSCDKLELKGVEFSTILSNYCNENEEFLKSFKDNIKNFYSYWEVVNDYKFYRISRIFPKSELYKLYEQNYTPILYNNDLLKALEEDFEGNGRLSMPLDWQTEFNGGEFGDFEKSENSKVNIPELMKLRNELTRIAVSFDKDEAKAEKIKSKETLSGMFTLDLF